MTLDFGGHSMVSRLKCALLRSPEDAGWGSPRAHWEWADLGFRRPPDPLRASQEHAALRRILAEEGCEVLLLPEGGHGTMDSVYTHDPSIVTDRGAIVLRMGKPARAGEPEAHRDFCRAAGIPVLGSLAEPDTAEAGDMVWLDESTLLVGRGYRTNAGGIRALARILAPLGVEVVAAPLPHGPGPDSCLHLMSLLSLLDRGTALVDLEWLAVETVELLGKRGFKLVSIVTEERDTLACNVLALGEGKLLALEENGRTNEKLRALGFTVRTFPGSEIGINGGGGPTCLTRPILRA